MKTFYKKAPIASFFLFPLFILMGCSAYEKVPISLDEAVKVNTKVKVLTADHKKYKFRKIQKTDSTYYGLAEVRDQIIRVPIQKDKIQNIRQAGLPASSDVATGTANIAIVMLYVMGLTTSGH